MKNNFFFLKKTIAFYKYIIYNKDIIKIEMLNKKTKRISFEVPGIRMPWNGFIIFIPKMVVSLEKHILNTLNEQFYKKNKYFIKKLNDGLQFL